MTGAPDLSLLSLGGVHSLAAGFALALLGLLSKGLRTVGFRSLALLAAAMPALSAAGAASLPALAGACGAPGAAGSLGGPCRWLPSAPLASASGFLTSGLLVLAGYLAGRVRGPVFPDVAS